MRLKSSSSQRGESSLWTPEHPLDWRLSKSTPRPTWSLPSPVPTDWLQCNMGAVMQITSRVWLSLPFSD